MQTAISINTPFRDEHHVLSYYVHHHPARLKGTHISHSEIRTSDEGNLEKWTAACSVVKKVLTPFEGSQQGRSFAAWYLIHREEGAAIYASKDDLAKAFGVNRTTLWRWHSDILHELRRQCIIRELIPLDKHDEAWEKVFKQMEALAHQIDGRDRATYASLRMLCLQLKKEGHPPPKDPVGYDKLQGYFVMVFVDKRYTLVSPKRVEAEARDEGEVKRWSFRV